MVDETKRSRSACACKVAIAAASVAVIAGCANSSSVRPAAVEASAKPAVRAVTGPVAALLSGIPQSGSFLGSAAAPVTLQYFIDVACPPSREITTGPLASIIRKWVRPGRLRIEFRSIEEGSEPREVFTSQQVAALAAGQQNRLWDYLEYFYQSQLQELGSGNTDSCHPLQGFSEKVAREVPGLNLTRWNADLHSQRLASEVEADQRIANIGRLENPAYLIGRSGAPVAVTLLQFSRTDPAYHEVTRALLTATVHL